MLHGQSAKQRGRTLLNLNNLVLCLLGIVALAPVELHRHYTRCFWNCLKLFVLGVGLVTKRKFRGACKCEAGEVCDDVSQVIS